MPPDPLPSAPPPPPPPPPPPYSWSNAGGAWGPPGGWPPPTGLRPTDGSPAFRSVRDGVAIYRWVVILALLGQIVGLATVFADPDLGRLSALSPAGGTSFSSSGTGLNGPTLALAAATAIVAFASFILSVIAFARWRTGVIEIRRTATSLAPFEPPRLQGPAAQAETGYRHALWTMLAWLLTVIAGGVVIAAALISSFNLTPNANGTVPAPTTAQVNHAISSIVVYAIGLEVVLVILQLVLAGFVLQSLEGFLELGSSRPASANVASLRWFVYLGILLGVTSGLNLVVAGAGAIAIGGPVLLLLASQRYVEAFDAQSATRTASPTP